MDEATDGDEGLEAMQQRWYDCVLCDLNMPRMDGLECVASLRAWEAEHRPHRRQLVCCVTGEDGRSEEEILSAGMDRVLRKPITWDKVEEVTMSCDAGVCETAEGAWIGHREESWRGLSSRRDWHAVTHHSSPSESASQSASLPLRGRRWHHSKS